MVLAPRRVHQIVADVLRAAIEEGDLPAGGVLRESMVAEAFEVSRIPIGRALTNLESQRLVGKLPTGGFFIMGSAASPEQPVSAEELRRVISPENRRAVRLRNWRDLIYPEVERDVAGALMFGRFQIRSQALAQHYGVSRTVATELMTRLERVGIIRQGSNARWYAGPLTRERICDLFEVRWLLEPAALRQAAKVVSATQLAAMRDRVKAAIAQAPRFNPLLLHRLETDLHHGIVLRCANTELRDLIYRCQLPLIASHLAFSPDQARSEVPPMLEAHLEILDQLIAGQAENAAQALEAHLRQSESAVPDRLLRVPQSSASIPKYLTRL